MDHGLRMVMAVLLANSPAPADGFQRSVAESPRKEVAGPSAPAQPSMSFDRIERLAFNRRAVELDQPIFWRADANGNGTLDPDELVVTWGHAPLARTALVDRRNEFTPRFRSVYERMLRPDDPSKLDQAERERRKAVRRELSQGRPTLVETDFSGASDSEKRLVAHLLRVAALIEHLYARQKGTADMERGIPPDDPASAAMFFRNHGPLCEAPRNEKDPACRALPAPVEPILGLYPGDLQKKASFCALLQTQKNAAQLADHFSVVRGDAPNGFLSVKYSAAYADDMEAVAKELDAAGAQLEDDEAAFKKYLRAAARAFRDDDWQQADQAWVAMGDGHSKYFLRVGPDEVYFEPCAWKAAFAFAFARVNKDSLAWQRRLEPMKQEMEDEFARLSGKPYRARRVRFRLPSFIDVVLNAGNTRFPLGLAVGQSLPNWGPLADEGGRTMIVSNAGADVDSQKALMTRMASLFCHATLGKASTDPKVDIMSTVLHEAAHNLGPTREHKVGGSVDQVIFGGPLALMLDELKAETAALYFPAKLVRRNLVSQRDADVAKIQQVAFAFGSIAQGMYAPDRRPNPYGQLASIQLGFLRSVGVLEWKEDEMAGNGEDRGCFELREDKWQAAVTPLVKRVLQIKSRGDRSDAERLVEQWVADDNDWKKIREVIAQRWLREPRGSFVYSLGGL